MAFDFFKFSGDDKDAYKSIVKNAKEYGELQLQMLKLNSVSVVSQIVSYILAIVISAVLIMTAFVYFSVIFVILMKEMTGSWIYSLLIMGAIFLLLFFILWKLREKIMLKPIIRKICSILFSADDDDLLEENVMANGKPEVSAAVVVDKETQPSVRKEVIDD